MKKQILFTTLVVLIVVCVVPHSFAQKKRDKKEKTEKTEIKKVTSPFSALPFRSIGPSFTSGRIADIAVNPNNHSEYYVAVASGHLWKTTNSGTTWEPIFDKYKAYSMGCVTIDPTNEHVVWLGTGENNHQRALGYGNGVWKSLDGGKTWQCKGLKESRQIGKIVIDPTNSDIVYVAAEGSAWGPGGDRGLYKTTDGGQTWECVLEISENTGINEIVMDPRDPSILYATSEQRRRRNFSKIGGGPESKVYKTVDGGKNWKKIMNGLPSCHIGGMGLAISPVNPDYLYLIMEAQGESGGFFRSIDRGQSWEKRSSHSSSGQYYNEIFCDPIDLNKVYSVETITHYTEDGGKTWERLSNNGRHVDDHALWIDPKDTKHFLIGGDGGLYETFDAGKNYLFKCNLPVTQFYRVSVDDSEPFYWVFGGTQDNNSLGGPSQNICSQGVASSEWIATIGGDGFFQAVEPGNPAIVYSEYQYGNIYRYDKKSGEKIKIKPEPREGEATYRWNWDTPYFISSFSPTRLYIGANKLFKSDDRGDTWDVISDDLTRNEDRNQFKVMGKFWPADAVAKDKSTSQWGTIISIAESPLLEGLLYVGTDDGVIQISENGGESWQKITQFPDVPDYSRVSDILPSKTDTNVVYASFDNIKSDDFKPYILKSEDRGNTWSSISNNLPENGSVLCMEQDQDDKNLLFIGTEFGVYFSTKGGDEWYRLKRAIPDVKICDMTIQNREKDLIVATFGRGFYILHDYRPMMEEQRALVEQEAAIFPIEDALAYVQTSAKYGQGATPFFAKNEKFGAKIRYHLDSVPPTLKQLRKKGEKKQFKNGEPIPIPDTEILKKEEEQLPPVLIFTIRDSNDEVVRLYHKKPTKGISTLVWDLRYASQNPIDKKEYSPYDDSRGAIAALPGTYTVEMMMEFDGKRDVLVEKTAFEVTQLDNTTLPAEDRKALLAYQKEVQELARVYRGAQRLTNMLQKQVYSMRSALNQDADATPAMKEKLANLSLEIKRIQESFYGNSTGASWEETPPQQVPLNKRMNNIAWSHYGTTMAPTATNSVEYQILKREFSELLKKITAVDNATKSALKEMEKMKAVWTPGQVPQF